jgi:uncharacterized iron-regulated membrane protein
MTFRKIIFWLHLIAGVVSGISIAIMCFTGTALAFEKQLVAWSQRDARKVALPTDGTPPLTLDQLRAKLRDAKPEANATNIVIQNNPRAAVAFSAGGRGGGGGSFYVNPYTGEVRQPRSSSVSGFMQTMTSWHRYLGFTGTESRPRGKLVNGVCNLAFCVLAISGLYLWIPRNWSLRGLKAIALFNWRLTGKARDFNWHNSIGLWSAPILIVLTLTAVPISFQWGGRVINALTGTPQPATGTAPAAPGGGAPLAGVVVPPPTAGARLLSQDALIAAVQKEIPAWETITIAGGGGRGGPSGRGGTAGPGGRGGRGEGAPVPNTSTAPGTMITSPATETPAPSPTAATTAPATFTVRSADTWPRTSNITLALNPYTGEVLRRTGYADQAPAQRVRAWTRFLHTGEALGLGGQLVAGLACLGGCFLVYTGFALAWRRFFPGSAKRAASPSSSSVD